MMVVEVDVEEGGARRKRRSSSSSSSSTNIRRLFYSGNWLEMYDLGVRVKEQKVQLE